MSAVTVWAWAEEVQRELGVDRVMFEIAQQERLAGGHVLLGGQTLVEHPLYDPHRQRLHSAEQGWVIEVVNYAWTPVTDLPSRTYELRRWIEDNTGIADETSDRDRELLDELSLFATGVAEVEAELAALRVEHDLSPEPADEIQEG